LTHRTATETYDLNGNLATFTDASGTTTYTWNARNQLTGISGPGVTGSFTYDSFGRRTGKTINATTTNFVYDGLNPVQEKSGAIVTANLLTGLGIDEFFTRTDGVGVRSLLPDALGSTVALGDGTGTLQTQYTYEPFGFTTQTGAASTSSYKYTGREDDGTGLMYYRARYYQPRLQRFISEDPIRFYGGDTNLYGYAFNTPVQLVDPTGNAAISIPLPNDPSITGIQGLSRLLGGLGIILNILSISGDTQCSTRCPPCSPYVAGTIGYLGPHNDHDHYPIGRPHLNLLVVRQRPGDCKCFWNTNNPDVASPPPLPGWVDLNNGFPALSP
jgi:RHS repeat-associated protein